MMSKVDLKKAPRLRTRKSIERDKPKKMPGRPASAAAGTPAATLPAAPQTVVQPTNMSGTWGASSPTALSNGQTSPGFFNVGQAKSYINNTDRLSAETPAAVPVDTSTGIYNNPGREQSRTQSAAPATSHAQDFMDVGSLAEFVTPEKASENQRAKIQLSNLRNRLNAATQFQNDEEELALRAARDPQSVISDVYAVADARSAYEKADLNERATRAYEDKFIGQFAASQTLGRFTQDESMAWNNYLVSPTQENRRKAEEISAAKTQFVSNNEATLANDATLPWISQSLAGYLPQFTNQLQAQIIGGAAGGAAGSVVPIIGTTAGAITGTLASTGIYTYNTIRGATFKNLLDLGVDEETARAAANDEAVISALIEMVDTGIDLLTLGTGKLISLIAKGGIKSLAKKGAAEVAETAGKKFLKLLAGYGINVAGEAVQEGVQEAVSITNERRTQQDETGKLNLVGNTAQTLDDALTGKNPQDAARIETAAEEGAKISAFFGGSQAIGSNIGINAMDRAAANFRPNSTVNLPADLVSAANAPAGNNSPASVSAYTQPPAGETKAAANAAAQSKALTREEQILDGIKQLGENGMKAIVAVADKKGNLPGYVQGFAAYYRVGLEGKDLSQAKTAHEFRLSDVQRLGAYFSGQNDAALAKAGALSSSPSAQTGLPNALSSSPVSGLNTAAQLPQKMQSGVPARVSAQTASGYTPGAGLGSPVQWSPMPQAAQPGGYRQTGQLNSLSKNPLADSQDMDYYRSADSPLWQLAYEMATADTSARTRQNPAYVGDESSIYALKPTDGAGNYKSLVEKAKNVDVWTSAHQAVFYSGKGNRARAEAFAELNGKTTLEMTPGGRYFDSLKLFEDGSPVTKDQAYEIWKILSERYAKSASGNVYGFVKGSFPESIFNTVEYPALQKNPYITNIFTELLN